MALSESRAAASRQVVNRRVDQRGHLELVVELLRRRWPPDRLARAADLRDVGEVEDRESVPGLRHRAATALPHGANVAFEGVEVADADDRQQGDHGGLGLLEDVSHREP